MFGYFERELRPIAEKANNPDLKVALTDAADKMKHAAAGTADLKDALEPLNAVSTLCNAKAPTSKPK
jgi:hypothetical protein